MDAILYIAGMSFPYEGNAYEKYFDNLMAAIRWADKLHEKNNDMPIINYIVDEERPVRIVQLPDGTSHAYDQEHIFISSVKVHSKAPEIY